MAKLTNPEPLSKEVLQEFERLRAENKLRSVTANESGTGVKRLPNGVYGFTYSPFEDNFPLFDDRDLRSFESHKLADGSVFVLGFLTSEEKASFEKGSGPADIQLFPEPKGSADQLVRVPASRVLRHGENSARRGTGLEIQVRPAS